MNPLKLVKVSDNCKHWSGADAIKEALECVQNTKEPVKQALVTWYEKTNDKHELNYRVAGVSKEEHIAMLSIFMAKAIDEFRGRE